MKKNFLRKSLIAGVCSLAFGLSCFGMVGCSKNDEDSGNAPILIASANDFAALGSKTEYSYYKLTKDIDLRNLSDEFGENGNISSNFIGEIDGNGHTIIMNDDVNNYIFNNIEGYFHDFTLNFPNVEGKRVEFSNKVVGNTKFKNITTTGSISLTTSDTNYSPYVSWVTADVSFENCTNSLDIVLPTNGSLFVGGYATDGRNDLQDENIVGKGMGNRGVLKDSIKVSYKNCKNTAHVEMEYASMLYGNYFRLPKKEDLTIENCVNEGTIIGYQDKGLFCGLTKTLGRTSEGNGRVVYQYLDYYFDYGDYDPETGTQTGLLASLGDNLKNTGSMLTVETKDLITVDTETNTYKIINAVAGNSYEIILSYYANFVVGENQANKASLYVPLLKICTATTSGDIETSIKNLQFLSDRAYNNISNKTEQVYTDLEVSVEGDYNATLYIVTDTDSGIQYYYVKIDEISTNWNFNTASGFDASLRVYERNQNGDIIARSK